MTRFVSVVLALVITLSATESHDAKGSGSQSTASHVRSLQDESTTAASYVHGIECTPCEETTGDCVVTAKVNFFAGETGTYRIVVHRIVLGECIFHRSATAIFALTALLLLSICS